MLLTYAINKNTHDDIGYNKRQLLMAYFNKEELNTRAAHSKNFFRTHTLDVERCQLTRQDTERTVQKLLTLDQVTELTGELSLDYTEFRIPKASGGTRVINAPNTELKIVQRGIVDHFKNELKIHTHDCSYAYAPGRCAYDALVTHQHSNARFFLKLDIKDFFPSIKKENLISKLKNIVPLNFMNEEALSELIEVCVKDDALPQGAPTSPMLSNLYMLEFDKELSYALQHFKMSTYCYTRYADDILISNPYAFRYQDIVELVEQTITRLGLCLALNKAKIRYGSMAGRNWNLGLMYNQDQQITVGNSRKKRLNATLNAYILDEKNDVQWTVTQTQELIGQLAYLSSVEQQYYNNLIEKYEKKYNVILREMWKTSLNR